MPALDDLMKQIFSLVLGMGSSCLYSSEDLEAAVDNQLLLSVSLKLHPAPSTKTNQMPVIRCVS
jgi:hypothetical protein